MNENLEQESEYQDCRSNEKLPKGIGLINSIPSDITCIPKGTVADTCR